jgi:cellobiose-specific phosphotransferase system component IIB
MGGIRTGLCAAKVKARILNAGAEARIWAVAQVRTDHAA